MTNNPDIRNFIISIFYILFSISVISGHTADENNHNVVKRMEIETCLGKFQFNCYNVNISIRIRTWA